jgi:hypothetical protein
MHIFEGLVPMNELDKSIFAWYISPYFRSMKLSKIILFNIDTRPSKICIAFSMFVALYVQDRHIPIQLHLQLCCDHSWAVWFQLS